MLEIVVALLPHSLLLLVILVPCLDIIPVQPIGLPHRMRVPIALLALPGVGLGLTRWPERHCLGKLGCAILWFGNLTDLHTRHLDEVADRMFHCSIPLLTLGLTIHPIDSIVIPGIILKSTII